jgi:peptidoglycan/LPS O-acetylase OafA/YrhL
VFDNAQPEATSLHRQRHGRIERMKHLPALDGLRAFAILTVVASHVLTPVIPGGFGVTLFFFISGFIITRMMLSQDFGRANIKAFYVRRFFRLAPALFVFILLSGLAMWCLGLPIPAQDYLATLFYFANYHQFAHDHGVNSPLGITWSLAVEEHFYFGFPLLFVRARRNLAKYLIAVVLGVLAWRCTLVFGWHVPTARTYLSTDTRLDSIAWGCLLSVMIHERSAWLAWMSNRLALTVSALVLLGTLAIRDEQFRETFRYSLQGIALMPIFCRLFWDARSAGVVRTALESPGAVFIGNISYSLYLYHFLALSMAELLLPRSAEMKAAAIVCGFAAAIASYYLVENPVRRIGSRLAKTIDARAAARDAPAPA